MKTALLNADKIRLDGRKLDELRPVKIEVGVIKNADGSALIEFGKNKIMAAVYGPKEVHPKHLTKPDRAIVKCRYHMTPFSTDTRKNPSFSRREIEISKVIKLNGELDVGISFTDECDSCGLRAKYRVYGALRRRRLQVVQANP